MKGIRALPCLAMIAVALVAGGCQRDDASTKGAFAERSPQVDRGAALFARYCSTCHGEKGSGGHMTAPLAGHSFSFGSDKEQLMDTIRRGRPQGMPAFKDSLDEAQIAALASYLRWLQ
ncbi:MAG: c-type cytochrome [Desulfuromonadales bacterium]|nr:c-type cytochrome [Desulfuromonadales bacterium]NIR33932.1 c-type cytochrome [Desulfuromonadales bacterium]NIS43954.1 c-type cytochrome [Desulfuromonadales bacterium]